MSKSMYGVVNGVYYFNNDRLDEINNRIYSRNESSMPLQPQFSVRPISTKYAYMHVVDGRKKPTVELNNYPQFSVNKVFNPGNKQAPWSGFASNIDSESSLRSQNFALQSCNKAKYIPDSNSDMFIVDINDGIVENQPFPGLFQEPNFNKFNPNTCNTGKDLWGNCTRQQIRLNECCNKSMLD